MFLKENSPDSVKKSKKSKKMDKPEKCPLCCENLEPDDLNFLPCPCGYKVCLFCWNRIRTNENDPKCPLCRRTYSENPAKFEPLSAEQLQKLKNKKKQEDVKKKQKLAEDRKQLADVRVVRKNLIFVNELPINFSKDPKLYQRFLNIFKQAGHIKKASVLNSSKNYAGQKAPFARAYITYQRNEEALKALKIFENVEFEGRELKVSLGTTKYCSNYIKNVNCVNKECVYLHEQADAEASFTKEQIHAGKHVEYGQKLYDQYVNSLYTKSITNTISEEKKVEFSSQSSEDLEKEIITENSSTSQQQSNQPIPNERNPSPERINVLKQFQEIMKAAECTNISRCDMLQNLSRDQCNVLQKLITLNIPQNSPPDLNKTENESVVETEFVPSKESLLSRLNLINSHSVRKDPNSDSLNFEHEVECNDDCSLDFDPVQMALGRLDELVISEKQKAKVEVDPVNTSLVNSFKNKSLFPPTTHPQQSSHISSLKSLSNQSLQQQKIQMPIYTTNNFAQNSAPTTVYQSRSQTTHPVDFFNQASSRPSVQSPTISRSSLHSQTIAPTQQRNQVPPPFASALTIQLPRLSSNMMPMGGNSMMNGFSPQQYMSQISPQEAYLLSQQQNQSFENFSQSQFNNMEQIHSPQLFNALQNQSIRDFSVNGSINMSFGQRIRNEAMGRQQSLQQQQLQHLQRLSSHESMNRSKGNNTFP